MDANWGNIPPWLPVDLPDSRKQTLHDIITALDVEKALRYAPRGDTYCNIFVWDVSRAAGCEIPHWYDLQTGQYREVGHGIEMHANRMVDWLKGNWAEMVRDAAFDAAAAGYLVVCGWRNPGGIGHVAVLLPEGTIAQAGASNFVGKPINHGFGKYPVRFFASPKRLFPKAPK